MLAVLLSVDDSDADCVLDADEVAVDVPEVDTVELAELDSVSVIVVLAELVAELLALLVAV